MMPNGKGHYETSHTMVRARKPYVKAGGITALEPLVRHGEGKLQEAASEVLKLLSQVDPPAPEGANIASDIPGGKDTRVAMFSARFDGAL